MAHTGVAQCGQLGEPLGGVHGIEIRGGGGVAAEFGGAGPDLGGNPDKVLRADPFRMRRSLFVLAVKLSAVWDRDIANLRCRR